MAKANNTIQMGFALNALGEKNFDTSTGELTVTGVTNPILFGAICVSQGKNPANEKEVTLQLTEQKDGSWVSDDLDITRLKKKLADTVAQLKPGTTKMNGTTITVTKDSSGAFTTTAQKSDGKFVTSNITADATTLILTVTISKTSE